MKYQLAPYADAAFLGKNLLFGFGSLKKLIEDPINQKAVIETACLWKTPQTESEIKEKLSNHQDLEITSRADMAIRFLKENRYLICEHDFIPTHRYSRNHLYFNLNGQSPSVVSEKLKSKHVLIIGAGGIGNYVSSALVGLGIGKLTIVDDDKVEVSNLSRQILFTENEVGKSKVPSLTEALRARNSEVEVQGLELKITSEDTFKSLPRSDLIILSADTPAQLIYWTNRYCVKNGIPYINVGYVVDISVWGPFVIPGKTGCFECRKIVSTEDHPDSSLEAKVRSIAAAYRPPSIGPINMLAASGAVLDAVKFLGDFGELASLNKRVGIWTDVLKIETQDCSKNPECEVCRHI